ncbi:hypothetical protein [Methylobacter sp. S3L5C]|nr:hypothetical protein [Methylobacter sp. S3L5C]UOA08167.1 hypothetical protein KKZ03_18455 [Methylobacter sp. S3L5C]
MNFAYFDGNATAFLGTWLKIPVTITLHGTDAPLSKMPGQKQGCWWC